MKITNYAIKNYQFSLVIVLLIAALGISTMLTMPRAEDPDMHAPSFPIVVVYPGASPNDIEDLVVKPIEKKIYGLERIKRIKTTISDGLAYIFVEYDYNSNPDDKYQELVREVNSLKSQLPPDIYSIDVKKLDPSGVNILQMELVSENASQNLMRKYARKLQTSLEQVPGLKDVAIEGLPEKRIRIDLDLDKMAAIKLPVDAVAQSLKSELTRIPGGSLDEGSKSFNIKTNWEFESIEEVQNMIITGTQSGTLHLKDIAKVYFDFAPPTHIIRLNEHPAVAIVAAQKKGQNISDVQKEYLPVITQFKKTLPANIDLVLHFDQAENVSHRLGGLGRDFMIAIGLVLLTLLPLGNRASLVVMLAIPLSLGIGIILLNVFGFSLNQLSIVGFVVALGLLVDDSIVVVENIERWMREGHSRLEATKMATGQIGSAVMGCTATLMIAFMPLLFLPDASGDFIKSLPVAILGTIFGSMIVALTIVPFFASRILKPGENEHGNIFLQYLQKGIHKTYAPFLDRALKHPVVSIIIAAVIFGGSLLLVPVVGTSLFPSSEKPQFMIDINAPLQSNLNYTDSVTRNIEKELRKMPEVKYFTSNVGKGNPRIYYNVLQHNESTDFGEIFVQLQPEIKANKKRAIIDRLRARWTSYLGARIEVKDFEQGVPMDAPVEVRLIGENLDTLRALAANVQSVLDKTSGTIYVNNEIKDLKSDVQLEINKEKAQSLGIPTALVGKDVRMAITGLPVGKLTNPDEEGDDYNLILTTAHTAFPDLSLLNRLYVNNLAGVSFPLSQITTVSLKSSPNIIRHLNKERTTSVTAFVKKGFLTDRVIQDVVQKMNQIKMPEGYSYQMGGELEGRNQSFHGFGIVILVTAFLFIAVLVLQFRTFKSTFIVLSVIPLGIVGALIALLLTDQTLSFVATIGIVALAGIEVKNTILQVDFTNELRERGMSLMEAVEKAGEARFLPIILTTLTAIGGLIPIALSSNPLISPLAIVMIGGLISSTFLSRIVTPVMYLLMPPKIEGKS